MGEYDELGQERYITIEGAGKIVGSIDALKRMCAKGLIGAKIDGPGKRNHWIIDKTDLDYITKTRKGSPQLNMDPEEFHQKMAERRAHEKMLAQEKAQREKPTILMGQKKER